MKPTKSLILASTLLVLAACSPAQGTPVPAHLRAANGDPQAAVDAEADVRKVVEDFGRQLQTISLLAPDAAQQIKDKYAPFVAPDLLEAWASDPSKAPGRVVSSPWPDHLEIGAVTEESPTEFRVTGEIIEMTSVELANGRAANRIPATITVEKVGEKWLITQYEQTPSAGSS